VSASLIVALASLALAIIGVYFAWRAHQARKRDRDARARFAVTIRTVDADEHGIRWTDAAKQNTRIGIGIKNVGEKAAGPTLINVVVPASLEYARWSGPGGEETPAGQMAAPTDELLPDAHGRETVSSKFLSMTLGHVGLRPHYEKFLQFPVDLPPRESGLKQTTVPVRVKVQADELPDDVDEHAVDYTVHVVRRG